MSTSTLISLSLVLLLLIIISGFFSCSETGMMSINRYRLSHLARRKHPAAKRVFDLLVRPDRLLGVILIGNNFANICATSIATYIAIYFFGEIGVLITSVLLTFIILIFAEVAPKTLAAVHPERAAFFTAWPLKILLKILYPLVWLSTLFSNGLLRLFGIKVKARVADPLDSEELRTVVHEAGGWLPTKYQDMLLGVLDLRNTTVNDIMIPRNEVVGIDLAENWNEVQAQLLSSSYSMLPVYYDSLDNVQGMINLRYLLPLLTRDKLNKENLLQLMIPVYFIPEGTPLNVQLIRFQQNKRHRGLVVDEYGDIQGLVTIEDLLGEIVGEYSDEVILSKDVHPQSDGSYLVDGGVSIRELNRSMQWYLTTDGPKTLSGLITEYLGDIPKPGTCLRICGYPIEVVKVRTNMVKTARIMPALRSKDVMAANASGKFS